MSLLGGAYVSLGGLLGFSRALRVVGEDVANLGTTGFKGSDLRFDSLDGGGAQARVAGRRMDRGERTQTGSDGDLALSGAGFFVLRDSGGGTVLTRAGRFRLDEAGVWRDDAGRTVLSLSGDGQLQPLALGRARSSPPRATSRVRFSGNLSLGALSAEVRGLQVFDASGGERLLDVTFTRSVARAGAWQVRVADATGSEVASGEIRFGGSGAPEPGFSTLALRLPGASADVLLDFGTPGSLEGATSFSSGPTSTVQARQEDGYPAGVLAAARIDDRGQVVLQYANGQERRGMQLAIATVADERQLESQDGVLFRAARGVTPVFGRAGESGRGTVVAGSLELANVDLSREFAEIVILQRGFQASSQILNVCSQAVEDLYSRLPGRS